MIIAASALVGCSSRETSACSSLPPELTGSIGIAEVETLTGVRWHDAGRRDAFQVAEGTSTLSISALFEDVRRALTDSGANITFSEQERDDAEVAADQGGRQVFVQIREDCKRRNKLRVSARPAT